MKPDPKPQDSFSLVIKTTLEEIQKEAFVTKQGDPIVYEFTSLNDGSSLEDQRRAIKYLVNENAISIVRDKYPLPTMGLVAQSLNIKSIGVYLNILGSEFNNLCSKFEIEPISIKKTGVEFDPQTSTLTFGKEKIIISKARNSDPHYLLETIFKDKNRIWNNDEIWESPSFQGETSDYDPKVHGKKIYNTAYRTNDLVHKETGVDDFLIFSMTGVSINKNYL